jgi:hypothetical protein
LLPTADQMARFIDQDSKSSMKIQTAAQAGSEE